MNTNPLKMMETMLNNARHDLQFQINAIVKIMEQMQPGFADVFRKQVFFEQCFSVMVGSAQLRVRPDQESLSRLKANNGLTDLLRKQAEDQGMMEVFDKAQEQAEHYAKEMVGKDQEGSIRILPH